MGAIVAWFTGIVFVLSIVLALHHLGVDVPPAIASAIHGVEQILGRPL
ncbi:MAG TPA: hypothetical protein VMH78_07775 [Thermoplasmata archaeon]|nr:hypothetical protein [Thermoplasmata archaeon]